MQSRLAPQLFPVLPAGGSLLIGAAITTARGPQLLVVFTAALVVVALTAFLPAELFIGFAVLTLGTYSVSQAHAFHVGAMTLYTSDILLGLLLLRGVLPRERARLLKVLTPSVAVPLGLYALLVLYAGWRGHAAGNSLGQISRYETSLIYLPLFSWGFARLASEKDTDIRRVIRVVVTVCVGFVAFALYARAVHQRFDAQDPLSTGTVVTSAGNLRRDYGLFTAFQSYPLLALAGISYLLFAARASRYAVLVTCTMLIALIMTLVRGMIFGAAAGAIVLAVLAIARGRFRFGARLVPILGIFVLLAVPFAALEPKVARGVAERVLPGVLPQSANADRNTQYRVKVFDAGKTIADHHTLGLGFAPEATMEREGWQAIYLPHSAWGSMLAFEGWPSVFIFVWLLVSVVRRSRQLPAAQPWLHPLVFAVASMVVVEGFGWNILFAMVSGLGMLGLIVGLRFGLPVRTDRVFALADEGATSDAKAQATS